VNYVGRSIAYNSLTANVLSADSPSSFSARLLMNLNAYQYPGREVTRRRLRHTDEENGSARRQSRGRNLRIWPAPRAA